MPKHPLAREIALLFAFKAVLITGLFLLFFSPSHRLIVTPKVMAAALTNAFPPSGFSQSEVR